MKKYFSGMIYTVLMLFLMSGCGSIGDKTTSMSIIYCTTAVLSFLLLIGYFVCIKKKEVWFVVLFCSVFIVNAGYFALSVSDNIEQALLANRIAYLGSAFLPLSMLMIILNLSKLRYKKIVPATLIAITVCVFLIAASPGYSDIYYKSVTLEHIDGVSVLSKEYGPWHCVYLYYLLLYFALMVSVILHSIFKKKLDSKAHGAILIIAVFVNICVWLLEQLIKIDFEFLSVSYIISELFLISLYVMLEDGERHIIRTVKPTQETVKDGVASDVMTEQYLQQVMYLEKHLCDLTATERVIYDCYIEGKSTKDIMQQLNITENTLKFHNKNIYSKLGVTSRKQIREYVAVLNGMKEKV